MKIVSKPIDVIVIFKIKEKPIPYKFKYVDCGCSETREIKVDKVITTAKSRIAGVETIVYRCQSFIGGQIITYELKYIIDEYRWVLYKL
ncbi:MAG: hypothetical protein GX078_04120 [Clostridiales bacterium]|jgi:hypothetical protein|nr:hypothetical protein [Clostridiales bacterium]